MCVRAHSKNFASNTGTPKLHLYEPFPLLYWRASTFGRSYCKTHFPVLSHSVNSDLKSLDLYVWGQDTSKLRPVTDFIASSVPRFIHARIPSVEANISSCWIICPGLPADSLLLRAPLTCEDELKDLSSNEWLHLWLHWNSYQKFVAYVQFSKRVTLLLLRDPISSLLTAYHFLWIWVCPCSLSYPETSDKILNKSRNKDLPVPLVLLKHKAE